jgi:cytoskeletal protein RodZ
MTQKTHFRPDQVEKIQQLGSHLKQRRQARSMSLEGVSAKTRISSRLLQAIEQAEVEALPQSVYLKGLLKRYADALELNGSELAEQFPPGDVLEGLTPSWQHIPSSKPRSLPLYFSYVFALVSAISGLSYWFQRNPAEVPQIGDREPQDNRIVSEDSPVHAEKRATPTVPEQSQPVASISATQRQADAKPVVVDITLKDECWLQIVADGKTQFEGILKKGEKRTWDAQEELVIRAGNAGGVVIAFNNEQAKPLGAPGQVETVTYQAPSLSRESQGG